MELLGWFIIALCFPGSLFLCYVIDGFSTDYRDGFFLKRWWGYWGYLVNAVWQHAIQIPLKVERADSEKIEELQEWSRTWQHPDLGTQSYYWDSESERFVEKPLKEWRDVTLRCVNCASLGRECVDCRRKQSDPSGRPVYVEKSPSEWGPRAVTRGTVVRCARCASLGFPGDRCFHEEREKVKTGVVTCSACHQVVARTFDDRCIECYQTKG